MIVIVYFYEEKHEEDRWHKSRMSLSRRGVSVASVSRVLAGHAGVSEAIRQRVLEAVQAMDYRPDLAAKRLRSRRTDTIGLIVSDIRNPFSPR